jgi:hypothetical protein
MNGPTPEEKADITSNMNNAQASFRLGKVSQADK